MGRVKRACAVVILLSPFICVVAQQGQDTAPSRDVPQLRARGVNRSPDEPVLLDAIVLDGKGRPIPGLQQKDFHLFEDKKSVPEGSWQLLTDGTPVSQSPQIIFVVDAVNSTLPDVARMEDALSQYLKKGKGPLAQRTSILFVSDAPHRTPASQPQDKAATIALEQKQLFVHRTATSTDRGTLDQELHEYQAGMSRLNDAQGSTVNSDRVRLSLQALSYIASAYTPIKGPKLILWLGPGWPFLAQSAAKSSEQLFDSVIYFTNLLQEAQMTLYSISPEGVTGGDTSAEMESFELAQRASSSRSMGAPLPPNVPTDLRNTYYASFLNGVRTARQSNPNDLDLQVLAFHTGGLVLRKNNDLVAQIERCVADAAGMYVFAYTPGKGARPDIYHDLEIRVSDGALPVRTQTGYYAK